ncbi:MAG: hypothetical protein Q4C67_03710 [Deinococcus sp.]|nr:hypothetical protein [Deinococcus sp.]
MTQPSTTTAPAPTLSTPTATTTPTAPLPRTQPASPTLNLDTQQNINPAQEAQNATQGEVLPADVQVHVSRFHMAMLSAQMAYDNLAKGYPSIWESVQYPVEYRRQKAAEFMDAIFAQQKTDLDTAAGALKAARDAVRVGLTPAMLGDPTTHEMKLLNAREDVKAAVEDLGPSERYAALVEMFSDATEQHDAPGVAYLLSATDFYKRVIRDDFTRAQYAEEQKDMLKKFYPTSEPYFAAGPVLDKLEDALQMAVSVRGFTAQDNGITLSEAMLTPTPATVPTAPAASPFMARTAQPSAPSGTVL